MGFTAFQGKVKALRILVTGEVCVDRYVNNNYPSVSPEADVPVIRAPQTFWDMKLGMAANVFKNLEALGANVHLATVVGSDLPDIYREKIGNRLIPVVDPSRVCAVKTRIMKDAEHVCRFDEEDTHTLEHNLQSKFLNVLINAVRTYDYNAVVLQDYGKGVWTEQTITIIQYCKAKNIPVFVDPYEHRDPAFYDGATILKPNLVEARGMLAEIGDTTTYTYQGLLKGLRARSAAEWVVLTLAADGMAAESNVDNVWVQPDPLSVVDPTGAGDTALSVMAVLYCLGIPMKKILEAANDAAGRVTQQLGVGVPRLSQLTPFLGEE